MKEYTFYAWIWLCITIMMCSLIGAMFYYHYSKPNDAEIMERLVRDVGINPMVIECMNRNWSMATDYEICKLVVEKHKISPENIKKLKKLLEDR